MNKKEQKPSRIEKIQILQRDKKNESTTTAGYFQVFGTPVQAQILN
jgi:hypothetical protein